MNRSLWCWKHLYWSYKSLKVLVGLISRRYLIYYRSQLVVSAPIRFYPRENVEKYFHCIYGLFKIMVGLVRRGNLMCGMVENGRCSLLWPWGNDSKSCYPILIKNEFYLWFFLVRRLMELIRHVSSWRFGTSGNDLWCLLYVFMGSCSAV